MHDAAIFIGAIENSVPDLASQRFAVHDAVPSRRLLRLECLPMSTLDAPVSQAAARRSFELLYGEITALQIVIQRTLGQMALDSGRDVTSVLRAEHGQASAELAMANIRVGNAEAEEAIRAHAQSLLDVMYSVASTTRAGEAQAARRNSTTTSSSSGRPPSPSGPPSTGSGSP